LESVVEAMLASASCVRKAWWEVTMTFGSETSRDRVLFCRVSSERSS